MSSSRKPLAKAFPLLFFVPIFSSLGNVMLGKGMRSLGGIGRLAASNLAAYSLKTLACAWIWLGMARSCSFIFPT